MYLILKKGLPSELRHCLKKEGAPDACLTYLENGGDEERCKENYETPQDLANRWESKWNKCLNETVMAR